MKSSSSSSSGKSIRTAVTAPTGAPVRAKVVPRTEAQQRFVRLLCADETPIVVGAGAAGAGKTLLATLTGLQKVQRRELKRLVIARPAVSVDEAHGFLPGTLDDKMAPWARPLYDILYDHCGRAEVEDMVRERVLEVAPLAFMRGRSLHDSWIILDEAQNTTPNQMLMCMTRLGFGSKLVITGDPAQHDRGFEANGLTDLLRRLEGREGGVPGIEAVAFGPEDVQRHPIIPAVLDLYCERV